MFKWFKRRKKDCKWTDSCNCSGEKHTFCAKCKYYFQVDSGYGFCKALPEFIVVAWCRDVCSLFKLRS